MEKLEKSICEASEDAQKQIRLHAETESEQQHVFEEMEKEFVTWQEDVQYHVVRTHHSQPFLFDAL